MAGTGDDDELARCKRALADALVRAHLDGLTSLDPGRRLKAACGLGTLGPAAGASVAALEFALADDDGKVRRAAAVALGRIRPPGESDPGPAPNGWVGRGKKQFLTGRRLLHTRHRDTDL
ncbi:MAG: hypothetical protein ABGY75_12530, partial [Gemmataceae bacterium]